METDMSANYPVLPVTGGAIVCAFIGMLAFVTYWLKQMARVQRHRRQANALAGLDRRMLADIGLTRSDVRDAFSEPFWEDPTALLHERAQERQQSQNALRAQRTGRMTGRAMDQVENGFTRPSTSRPARQAI
jgi:uncharacterized protein YjiS (DUF1127 family)